MRRNVRRRMLSPRIKAQAKIQKHHIQMIAQQNSRNKYKQILTLTAAGQTQGMVRIFHDIYRYPDDICLCYSCLSRNCLRRST